MKKRTVGGIGFVLLFYITLFIGTPFLILLSIFLVAGIFELVNIFKKSNIPVKTILYGICYIIFIFTSAYLSQYRPALIIYITILVMMDDTLAFAVGSKFGKHKLSKISPNKTIEGSLGGLLLAPFAAIGIMELLYLVLGTIHIPFFTIDFSTLNMYNPFSTTLILIIVSIGLAALAQCGDLVESYFKRSSGIKDSGKIVYGHGGILDRVDSWIFPIILITIIISVI